MNPSTLVCNQSTRSEPTRERGGDKMDTVIDINYSIADDFRGVKKLAKMSFFASLWAMYVLHDFR